MNWLAIVSVKESKLFKSIDLFLGLKILSTRKYMVIIGSFDIRQQMDKVSEESGS